jgi:hypothetical protein
VSHSTEDEERDRADPDPVPLGHQRVAHLVEEDFLLAFGSTDG